MLHFRIDARQVLHRPHHEGEIRDEGLDAADGHQTQVRFAGRHTNDETQREGGDDLHGGQEERREPRGAIRGVVHLGGQTLKLARVFIFAAQRLDHAHALNVLVDTRR